VSLDELILHSRIWRAAGNAYKPETISTGFKDLDRHLPGGGWPQKAITEIFVDRYGVGELSLLMPACVNQQTLVWVAPPYIPYAPALVRHGLDLERLLLVHPTGPEHNAHWATEQILRSKFGVGVLAWLKSVSNTVLRRLQLTAEKQNCWAVFFRPIDALGQRSPAALRLKLSRRIGFETDDNFQVEILKCRGGTPGVVHLDIAQFPGIQEGFDSGGVW